MRNTARMQVIALALLGAMAWISIHTGMVQNAVAGFLPGATAEQPLGMSPATSEVHPPILGERTRTPHIHIIPVRGHRVIHVPAPSAWATRPALDAFVS